ncbi:MAG: hypothetical protein FWG68_02085 [Defluviitaleaceae bacterium]|nr:hypothetical protein [Defluviitaleaceae bacterium]
MIITIIMSVCAVFFIFITWACLLKNGGCNWILLNGENIVDKDAKELFKARHDVPTMNRYLAKNGFLPLAVTFTLFAIIHGLGGYGFGIIETAAWQDVATLVIGAAILAVCVNVVRVYLQVIGGKFLRGKLES